MKVPSISRSLARLADLLDGKLYVVGGYVRNTLLGLPSGDVDIAAPLSAGYVTQALSGSGYTVVPSSPRLGTLMIKKEGEYYEFTSFRSDSYPEDSGVHAPDRVVFTDDIYCDARRRDFKANAVYYDIRGGEYIDPLGGIADIEKRVLSATREPNEVLKEDGLRILRLIRQSAELGFSIEEGTYAACIRQAKLLADISGERKREELERILRADGKYGQTAIPYAHCYGVRLMFETGAMEYVIPELAECVGVEQNTRYHRYDVAGHIVETLKYAEPDIRLAALLHDVAKPAVMKKFGNMYGHAEAGAELVGRILERLKYPAAVIKKTQNIVRIHMYDINGDAGKTAVRRFIAENREIIPEFLALRQADYLGGGLRAGECPSAAKIRGEYEEMKRLGLPMSVGELKINGGDAIAAGYSGKEVGDALERTLDAALLGRIGNSREEELAYIARKED